MKKYAFILLCLATAAHAQTNSRLQKVDSLLKTIYTSTTPGISIAIMQQGQLTFKKSYGLADITTKQPLTDKSNFNIASLTKQFTAIGILQLERAGKLRLDDKLSRYFPDMVVHIANTVTLRQLLTHTSGIVDHYNYTNTKNMQHAHNADVYAAIKNVDGTYFTPGTKFRYSNTAFCLLALVIEKVSGLPYATYMQQNVFTPAGMLHSTIWSETANIPQQVTGYDVDSATHSFIVSGPAQHIFFSTEGDGGLFTSIDDYLHWFKALQGGKVFPFAIVAQARSLHFIIDTPTHTGYGYGWFVSEGTMPIKVYHSGDNGGFRTYSFSIPSLGYLVVVFSNRSDINVEEIVKKINALLLGEKGKFKGVEEMTS